MYPTKQDIQLLQLYLMGLLLNVVIRDNLLIYLFITVTVISILDCFIKVYFVLLDFDFYLIKHQRGLTSIGYFMLSSYD